MTFAPQTTHGNAPRGKPRDAAGPTRRVPAVAEAYKGFEVYSWVGMVAPAKTPEPVLDRLAAGMAATLRDPEVAKRLTDGGFDVVAGSREQMNRHIKSESERWGQLIRSRHIAVE